MGAPRDPPRSPGPPCTPSIKQGSDSNEAFLEGLRALLSKANCKLTVCSEQDTRSDRWIQVGTPGHSSVTPWLGQRLECQGMEQGTGTEPQGMLSGVARTRTMPGEPWLAQGHWGSTGTGTPWGWTGGAHCQGGDPSEGGDPGGTLHEGPHC